MYAKRDAQYFAVVVVVVVVSASSSSQRVVRVFFVFFIFFTSPSTNTADRERSFLFAHKNEEKSFSCCSYFKRRRKNK